MATFTDQIQSNTSLSDESDDGELGTADDYRNGEDYRSLVLFYRGYVSNDQIDSTTNFSDQVG